MCVSWLLVLSVGKWIRIRNVGYIEFLFKLHKHNQRPQHLSNTQQQQTGRRRGEGTNPQRHNTQSFDKCMCIAKYKKKEIRSISNTRLKAIMKVVLRFDSNSKG